MIGYFKVTRVYMLYLPTEEELQRELQRERELVERQRMLENETNNDQ